MRMFKDFVRMEEKQRDRIILAVFFVLVLWPAAFIALGSNGSTPWYWEVKSWQSFFGSYYGALFGLLAILIGALFNAHLTRQRESKFKEEEARSVAAAIAGQMKPAADHLRNISNVLPEMIQNADQDLDLKSVFEQLHRGCDGFVKDAQTPITLVMKLPRELIEAKEYARTNINNLKSIIGTQVRLVETGHQHRAVRQLVAQAAVIAQVFDMIIDIMQHYATTGEARPFPKEIRLASVPNAQQENPPPTQTPAAEPAAPAQPKTPTPKP